MSDGLGRPLFKRFHVNPQATRSAQQDQLFLCDDEAGMGAGFEAGLQGPSRHINDLMQVVAGGFRVDFGPEKFHHLLPVKLMLGLQRQKFYQHLRLPAWPSAIFERRAVHSDLKWAEQADV